MSTDARRIPSLDGLRALSIGLVILSHLLGTRGFPFSPRALGTVGDFGYLGVKVFFVISGYLITSLLIKEMARTGTISLLGFYQRRAWRIFPAFYAFVGAMCAAWALGVVSLEPGDLLAAVTYTMNYHYTRSWELGHIWSLSIEEQFYLVWPFLFLLTGKKYLVHTAIAIMVVSLIVRSAAWFHFRSDDFVEEGFPSVMGALAVGGLFAGLQRWLDTAPRYLAFLRSPLFLVVPIAVVVFQYPSRPELAYTIGTTFVNLGLALCVDRCVRVPDDWFGKLLNWGPLVWIGTLSYSLYLWQEPFLNHNARSELNTFPFNLAAALVCAMASYYLIERPTLALRDRRARRRRTPVPTADPPATA